MESAGQKAPDGAHEGAGSSARRFGVPEVYALIGLLSFLVARFVPVLELHFVCPFRALTGLPCATCGMTHAFVHLAHGEIALALGDSPLGVLLGLCAWAYAASDLARALAGLPLPRPPLRLLRGALWAGLAALAANWAYLVVRELGA